MENMQLIWLIATVIFAVAEGVTYQLVSIWFAGGSIGAMIASLLGANIFIQIIVFVAVSAVFLIFTRPIAKRAITNKIEKTNTDSLIGKTAVITHTVDNINATGELKVNGVVWTARSADDSLIEKGETVKIERIEGVKLIVKK